MVPDPLVPLPHMERLQNAPGGLAGAPDPGPPPAALPADVDPLELLRDTFEHLNTAKNCHKGGEVLAGVFSKEVSIPDAHPAPGKQAKNAAYLFSCGYPNHRPFQTMESFQQHCINLHDRNTAFFESEEGVNCAIFSYHLLLSIDVF